jgi:tRNA(fMet)-specific endonuclease VapC
MIRYLLDANVVQEPVKSAPNPNVLRRLMQHRAEFAIASIAWHELWFGCQRLPFSQKRTAIEAYLQELIMNAVPILAYDTAAAEWHARERSHWVTLGRTPPFADGQIAAVAAVNGLILVTRNVSDFAHFRNLSVENWFDPIP